MDVSRSNFGKISLRLERVDICKVRREAEEVITARAREKQIALQVNLPAKQSYLEGDALRLQQLFVNLLDNAVKYTQAGGNINLQVELKLAHLTVAVLDNGVGLAKKDMQTIFRMFDRVTSREVSAGRLGVGLALAKSLVEMHNGRLDVTSPGLGMGSCFNVTLPLSEDQSQPAQPLALQPVPYAGSCRIVVADDSTDIASTFEALFDMEATRYASPTTADKPWHSVKRRCRMSQS